jgi:hypothetical protein
MALKPAGNEWLKAKYSLNRHMLTHTSYIGSNPSIELTSAGNVEQVYPSHYAPKAETNLAHLEFALKYDDLNLDFLKSVFAHIPQQEITAYIEHAPTGKYARKIGFLYEFLTGKELVIGKIILGNYSDLLETEKYITGKTIKNNRWRINDNLPGTRSFCPMVRRTAVLNKLLQENIPGKIKSLKEAFPEDIFRRATNFLYKKETRSSYEIEKEEPSPDRMEKFIALLMQAGTEPKNQILEQARLVQLQNAIVDPRFAVSEFRDFQNYIGQSLGDFRDLIHYICPPPTFVESLMDGLKQTAIKTQDIPAEIRAALLSFGFVFIHPFEDGNGRIHRFLIHDILVSDGLVPQGLIIPVSAHMLNHMGEYNQVLERYSKPLMFFVRYDIKANGELVVKNSEETEGYFRYPDLTEHCIYLAKTIHATLGEDMPDELNFIQRYDEVKTAIQNIVDMPDKLVNNMIVFLHQNKGVFPKRRREYFAKLSDDEISKMQAAFRKVFEMDLR